MHLRSMAVVAAFLLLAPAAARAEDTLTSTTTPASDTTTVTVPPLDLADQLRTVGLIAQRSAKLRIPERSGELAMNADGSELWVNRANMPLMPASTMKVITATVALQVLGPTWKPVTRLDLDTATGTLTLVGGGDPQLSSDGLDELALSAFETLTALGVSPSRLAVDDALFPAPTLQPGVTPAQQPSEERPIRALVVDQRRIGDSALDAGKAFRRSLADVGVLVPFVGRAKSTGTPIASINGNRLQTTLRDMLWYSDNDIAEMALRLAAVGAGVGAEWSAARSNALAQLKTLGVPTKYVKVVDGAGLSRNNRLTPRAIAETLRLAAANPRTTILQTLLPTAGVNGTLRKRYATPPSMCVRGILKAKTGSLHDVIALAGYAPAKSGAKRPFAIMVNGVANSATARNKTRLAIDGLAASFAGC